MTSQKELRGGRYALLRTLGEGTQGETWEAVDRGIDKASLGEQWSRYVEREGKKTSAKAGERVVAIKCFRLGKAKAWKDVELAEREARTLAALDHPALPRYVEHFEEDGALYLVMEKIDGESLAAIRARGHTLAPGEIAKMLEDIAAALRYLHGRAPPIVHRDIKPGNVIRRPNGTFALVDFGVVRDKLKPSGGSTVVGTFGYMAPEQFQGRASPKSDVYGLGATALAMLTGAEPEDLPHEGLALAVAKAVPETTSPALVAALEAMLEPDPDRRIASVEEALAILEDTKRARPREPRWRERSRREERRREEREEKHARRAEQHRDERGRFRRPHRVPLVARMLAKLGLLIALVTTSVVVGVVVPFLLILLSLLFGQKLRRAAAACVAATKRAQTVLIGASARVSGREPQVRVAETSEVEAEHTRIALEAADEADEWLDDRLEEHDETVRRRERMKSHATPPPRRKHWGR